jgi:hypothetical protein
MKKIIFCLLLLVSTNVMSQGTHAQTKIAPFFLFDTYYSFIGNKGADVWGFKGGITWNDKWKFGAGFNKIKSDIVEEKALPSDEIGNSIDDTVKSQLYLRYYPLMAEYTFYEKDDWQISSPICLGYGRSYFEYFDKNNDKRSIYNHGVLISDIGINAQYKVLKWVGLGGGVGYRFMLISNPEIDTDFSSMVYSIRIKVFLGEIMKTIFPDADFSLNKKKKN